MADLPRATTTINDQAGSPASGTELLAVLAAVPTNADITPRIFASTVALLAKHDYSPAAEYCAMHFDETKKPVLFVGLPIVTAGTLGRINQTGNTGTCVISVAAGTKGVLEECDGQVRVIVGGTIGVNGIVLGLSLDGFRTEKQIKLGTATSYVIPYVGQTLSFAAGTLIAGDIAFKWSSTAPRWDQAGLSNARKVLAAQQKQVRSFLVVGDLQTAQDATDVLTEANNYETANDRYVFVRAQVRDRRISSRMSQTRVRMTGTPTITFTATTTVTRSTGSFISDGFAVNDYVTISGSASNNFSAKVTGVTATVLTFASGVVNEGPVSNVTIVASNSLTFATGANTITRSGGNFLNDGFAIGDLVTITGTASNNITGLAITNVTATVVTFGSGIANETAGSFGTTMTAGEDDPTWVAAIDSTFSTIDAQRRIDLGAGRGRKRSAIADNGWLFRRPVQWAASLREYQHDVQIPAWRKTDGVLSGWSLLDDQGNKVEHDERTDGGLLLARMTCFRTYANGPLGAFLALSLTRATEGSLLSRTHNLAVANVACAVCQAETENVIGQVLDLNADGTGTEASLTVIEERVNSALAIALLQNKAEGKRASDAKWKASRTDILNIPAAELTGTLDLRLKATVEKITTRVRVQTG